MELLGIGGHLPPYISLYGAQPREDAEVERFVGSQSADIPEGSTCAEALSQVLSGKKLKRALACRCGEQICDLDHPLPSGCSELEPVYADSPEGLDILRHSAAHVMAQAVKRLFPSAKLGTGPAIENGFYYDFDVDGGFTPEDLERIEQEMQRIVSEDLPLHRRVLQLEEARGIFREQQEEYKLELLEEMEEESVSVYRQDGFVDLCRGPHVPSTGHVRAFKLTSLAGAYWRGDENRRMLQRIYGTAWADEKQLKDYLRRLDEAKRRDHRKLGPQLGLFDFFEEAGAGMPVFYPKGALLRSILEDFEFKEHLRRGYEPVRGPQLLRSTLWQKSGHYDNYGENMYFTEIEGQGFGLKPMNCLAHILIYKSDVRSYRHLPLRYFELGKVNRHEKSGVLHGLMRVREFTQDDAHIVCRPDQLQEEIVGILRFIQDVMRLFDFEYAMELSTRPEKSIGSDEAWDNAISALESALEAHGLDYGINPGDGAFYGPKIDVKLKDALGRYWQCATIQCDFTLPERFDMTYVGRDGERHRPVMLHRVILGAIERFLGVLIEHYAGAFPTWLAPVQARIVTITDDHAPFAEEVHDYLRGSGVRAETDLRNEKLGQKIRQAQEDKIPYALVVGDQEIKDRTVNIRALGGEKLGSLTLEQALDMIYRDCREPFKRGGMTYSFFD
jgi:threonyl-tRNA synthetase